jgi:hypothetical protein
VNFIAGGIGADFELGGEAEFAAEFRKGVAVGEAGPHGGEIALRRLGELLHQEVAQGGLEDGIAQEFELLIVAVRAGPGPGRGMGEGPMQEIGFFEGVA